MDFLTEIVSQRALYTVCDFPVTEDRTAFPIVLTIGLILSFICVALRVTIRTLTRNIGWDDATAVLSMVSRL